MRILIVFLALSFSLAANQVISICYFDQDRASLDTSKIPNFLKESGGENVEKGYMLFYEKKMFSILSIASFYMGGDLGQYRKNQDTLYAGSLFFSSRLWALHLPLFHPYIEASLFGPTILSKTEFALSDLKSNFLFQNYLSVGAEVGAGVGLNVELKAVRYFRVKNASPENSGIQIPLLFSVGYFF